MSMWKVRRTFQHKFQMWWVQIKKTYMVSIRYRNNNQNAEYSLKRNRMKLVLGMNILLWNPLDNFHRRLGFQISSWSPFFRKRPIWNLTVPECWTSYGGSRNVYITAGSISNICDLGGFYMWFVGLLVCWWWSVCVCARARALCVGNVSSLGSQVVCGRLWDNLRVCVDCSKHV